jgi:hypothetical protein
MKIKFIPDRSTTGNRELNVEIAGCGVWDVGSGMWGWDVGFGMWERLPAAICHRGGKIRFAAELNPESL